MGKRGRRLGEAARATALRRFGIDRFVRDWRTTLDWYVGQLGERRAA